MALPGQFVTSLILAIGLAIEPPIEERPREASPSEVAEEAPAPPQAPPVETEPSPSADGESPPLVEDDEAEEEDDWDEEETWDDDYDPLHDSPEALQAQRRIAGGAVAIGLGALASIGALAMGLSDPCARPAGNSCSTQARNRAALTMGLPGVAILGAGVAVLALGLRQRKALRVGANVSPQGAGVVLTGRF